MHSPLRPEKPAIQRECQGLLTCIVTGSSLAGEPLCTDEGPPGPPCLEGRQLSDVSSLRRGEGRPVVPELVGASVDSHDPGGSSASVLQGEGARDVETGET